MSTRQQKAASAFGFTILGAAISLVLTYAIAKNDTDQPIKLSVATTEATSPVETPEPASLETPPAPAPAVVSELDPASVQKGKQNYDMFCLACHGAEDTTIDSPSNLFDHKWFHGSGREEIKLTIQNGIMEKGMPGWGAMIPAEDITALVDYLISFQKPNTSTDE